MKEHKDHTKTFEELTYNEQAKSITAQINVIVAAIRAHMRRAQTEENRDFQQTRLKCIGQLMRAVLRLTS
ncbi:MAG: hypothetical protein AB9882_08220 [Ignavibacteriaceae bacterium]